MLGFAVVSDQAAAIGVTAVPTPDTNQDSSLFFVFENLWGRIEAGGTTVSELGHGATYDSKAMRKVEIGQDIVQTVEAVTTSAIIQDGFRMLIKLH